MDKLQKDDVIHNIDITGNTVAVYSFKSMEEVLDSLRSKGIEAPYMEQVPMTLEDAFIGLTGKY